MSTVTLPPARLPPPIRDELVARLERLEVTLAARLGPLRAAEMSISTPPNLDRPAAAVRLARLEAVVGSQERPR